MARIIRLNESFTDTSLPVLRADPVLSAGSLLLAEPGHPAAPVTGLPASAALLPNIAATEAKALAGGTDADVSPIYYRSTNLTGTKGKAERSTKGGLHTIITQSAYSADGNLFQMAALSQKLVDYITNNPTHAYYVSTWGRITRPTAAGSSFGDTFGGMHFASTSPQVKGLWLFQNTGVGNFKPSSGETQTGAQQTNANTNGPTFMDIGVSALNYTPVLASHFADSTAHGKRAVFQAGATDVFSSDATLVNKWRSWVWYRTYIEDLTVSGRPYATVAALELGQYNKHVLTAGGRYFGDTTPTDPATIA